MSIDYYHVGRRSPVYGEDRGESFWRTRQSSSKQPPMKDILGIHFFYLLELFLN